MSLLKYTSWAVLIKDIEKKYKLIEVLKSKGYKVVGINEVVGIVDGIEVYESLKDVPHNIDVVGILEESMDTFAILDEMELLDIVNIWFEKDSCNDEVIRKAKGLKLNIEYNLNNHD